jgi:hypothetical protein
MLFDFVNVAFVRSVQVSRAVHAFVHMHRDCSTCYFVQVFRVVRACAFVRMLRDCGTCCFVQVFRVVRAYVFVHMLRDCDTCCFVQVFRVVHAYAFVTLVVLFKCLESSVHMRL